MSDLAAHPHDDEIWFEDLHRGLTKFETLEELTKSVKDAKAMYKPEHPGTPAAKDHLKWAYGKMPNENWSMWTVRHHREKPQDFTPEVKQKIEHFAGSQHIPEVSKVRFEKHHDLHTGLGMLDAAEKQYIDRTKANLKLAPKPATATKHLDLGNGLAWWSLGQGSCSKEGEAMGHCGNVPSEREGDNILSLRQEHELGGQKYYEPHLTFIQNGESIGEMKGRGNQKPAAHHHAAIAALFKKYNYVPSGGGYAPEQNFHIKDLPEETYQDLAQANPSLRYYRTGDTSPEVVSDLMKRGSFNTKYELAKDSKLHHLLVNDKDDGIRASIAADTNDPELHKILASDPRERVRLQIARNDSVSPEVRAIQANDPSTYVRQEVAMSGFTGHLTHDEDPEVRSIVARNKLTEPEQAVLVNDPYEEVRLNLAMNPNLSPGHQLKLAEDASINVRVNLARSSRLAVEAQHKLAVDPNYAVAVHLVRDQNSLDPSTQALLIKEGRVHEYLTERHDMSPETLNYFMDPKFKETMWSHLAKNTSLPKEMQKRIAEEGLPRSKMALLSNANVDLSLIPILWNSGDDTFKAFARGVALDNPSLMSFLSDAVRLKEVQSGQNLYRAEVALWLAQLSIQPLAKMAIDRKDMSPIARYNDDALGKTFVDDSKEHEAHPAEHQAGVDVFKHHVLKEPDVVKKMKGSGVSVSSNTTGKAVYKVKAKIGNVEEQKFMIKPYHEKCTPRMRAWVKHPIHGGWAEMTSQSLFHAAQIGDLHQRVHVAQVPIHEKATKHNAGQDKGVNALVVHMAPHAVPVRAAPDGTYLDHQRPHLQHQARQIALMDFLSNNLDRHGDNLMYDFTKDRMLAVDHSRSFQYASVDKYPTKGPVDDRLLNYVKSNGMTPVIPTPQRRRGSGEGWDQDKEDNRYWGEVDKELEDWRPVFDWWSKVGPQVRKTMDERLKLVRDTAMREHISRNFHKRADLLDQYAEFGPENFGHDDWMSATVPLYRFGTNDHND